MFYCFLVSMLCCFILFIWNLYLLDEKHDLMEMLDYYSYQIEQDTILFNDILEEVNSNED